MLVERSVCLACWRDEGDFVGVFRLGNWDVEEGGRYILFISDSDISGLLLAVGAYSTLLSLYFAERVSDGCQVTCFLAALVLGERGS